MAGAEDVLADDPIMSTILQARNEAPYFQLYYDQFLPPAAQTVLDAVQGLFANEITPEEAAAMIEESAAFELGKIELGLRTGVASAAEFGALSDATLSHPPG